MEKITSLQNKKVKEWCALHQKKQRDLTNQYLVEGKHLLQEAIEAKALECVLYVKENPFPDYPSYEVSQEVLNKVSMRQSDGDVIGICRRLEHQPTSNKRLLLLDEIQDPGNLGTLIRSAVSFQFDGIYLSEGCCDVYNEKVIQSTQGAFFHIPIVRMSLIDAIISLKKEGVKVIGTSLQESLPMKQLERYDKMAFLLGNEGKGVSKELLTLTDQNVRIEMAGFESLNVAVAGGILMYQYQEES